jgi:hypothetical protein
MACPGMNVYVSKSNYEAGVRSATAPLAPVAAPAPARSFQTTPIVRPRGYSEHPLESLPPLLARRTPFQPTEPPRVTGAVLGCNVRDNPLFVTEDPILQEEQGRLELGTLKMKMKGLAQEPGCRRGSN